MITYDDIKDMTNAEAIAYFGPLTADPIPCGDLENLLNWGGYANRNSVTGAWEGPLVDFMVEPYLGLETLGEGLNELFTHMNQPRSMVIDTTQQPWAGKMESLMYGLVSAGIVSTDLWSDVIALGGGQPNIGVDVQEIRDNEMARQRVIEWDKLVTEIVMPVLSDGTATDQQIDDAIIALADAWGE